MAGSNPLSRPAALGLRAAAGSRSLRFSMTVMRHHTSALRAAANASAAFDGVRTDGRPARPTG
jgi:hypothetical protein